MSRKTLIFGNGLGMALDPDFYTLDAAIGRVWDGADALNEVTKSLVRNCLPDDGDIERPHGEDDLDKLQLVVSACDFLGKVGPQDVHWLSEHGRKFPEAVRMFLYRTAMQFHQREHALPGDFTTRLASFIHDTSSHIATLNYDNLLYQPMIESYVLRGYSGALVDGLINAGFSEDNLVRKFGRDFGYYMHLHGSPLFVDRDNCIVKLRQSELEESDGVVGSHIVLTHVKHKETLISASPLLSAYWDYLGKALSESEEAVLFGYSGADRHLNLLLRSRAPAAATVVEWNGAGPLADRRIYWRDTLERDAEVIQLDNILEFTDW